MGAITFSLDPKLADTIHSALSPKVFVETGTFQGDSIAAVETRFEKVISIELSEPLWAESVKRFESSPRVEILHDDSRVALKKLRQSLAQVATLYWLDAHWCVASQTAGELSQCPLLDELDAIGTLNDRSVILIDDARLFLAPPPAPHEISHWPTFHEIVSRLLSLGAGHELMVVNDVIAYFPAPARAAMAAYAHASGIDWLTAATCLRENGSFIRQLEDKEAVIQQLKSTETRSQAELEHVAAAVRQRDGEIDSLRQDSGLRRTDLEEKEAVIGQLKAANDDLRDLVRQRDAELSAANTNAARLEGQAQAKEAVIQDLKAANDQAQARLAQQATEFTSSRQLLVTLEARGEVTEAVVRELKAAYSGAQAQLEQLRGVAEQRTAELAGVRQMLASSDADREAKEVEIRSVHAALEGARGQAVQLGQVIEQQTGELITHRQLIAAAEAQRMHLDELSARIAQSDEARRSTATALADARERLAAAEAKLEGSALQLADRDQSLKLLEQVIGGVDVASSMQTNRLLLKALDEKEGVIQELARAVDAYRSAMRIVDYPTRSAARVRSMFGGARGRLRKMSEPRLGRLHQYPPRPMRIPSAYCKPLKLSATPKVSIITPSFRQAVFIERTIDSVFEQNYPDLEYFVQDGGSTDGTVEILEKYADRLAGWESKLDGGQSHAINLGFVRTTGDIMAWINSDDVLLPGAVNCVVDYFNRHPDVDVVYGDRMLIDENDEEIGRWVMPAHDDAVLSWVDYVPQETMFWRRGIWDKAGGKIDETFRFAMDWDLLVRFRDAGAKFAHIKRFLGAFRVHELQKTSAVINEVGHREMDRIRERALGRIPDPIEIRDAVRPYLVRHVMRHTMHRIKTRLGSG